MIEKYEDVDDKHQAILEEVFPEFILLREKKKYKNAISVISSFIANVNFIKNGIYDLYESQNVYPIRILFRSLIEHFLRFQYLILRYIEIKDDSVFKEYIEYSRYTDEYQYGLSLKSMSNILDKEEKDFDPYEILKEFVPDLQDVSKKEFREKVEKYNIKRIISYINRRINKQNTLEGNAFILKLIPIYSELSSFVHGSFGAVETLSKMSREEDRINDMNQALKFSSLISICISSFSCLILVKEDQKFASFHNRFLSLFSEYK